MSYYRIMDGTTDGAEQLPVFALVRDLMFSSKITATARAIEATVRIFRDPAALPAEPARLLIVDLNLADAIAAAAQWGKSIGRPVVGFVSHVDAQTIAQAREAGIEQVMARSKFVEALPDLLKPAASRG